MGSTPSQPIDRHDQAGRRSVGVKRPRLHEYFGAMTGQGASDLHLKADAVAPNPDELKMRMKGISASRAGLRGR